MGYSCPPIDLLKRIPTRSAWRISFSVPVKMDKAEPMTKTVVTLVELNLGGGVGKFGGISP